MKQISRREFLKSLGLAGSGVLLAALPGTISGNGNMPLVCSYCGAQVARWNVYGAGNAKDMFCPNCGINIRRGTFTFRQSSGKLISKPKKKKAAQTEWECALVPFPNPDLVMQTGKPKMKLANIKF